jgi:hypothetical protein
LDLREARKGDALFKCNTGGGNQGFGDKNQRNYIK